MCSGGRNCECTNFQRKKSSARCKNCSHDSDNHIVSSDNDGEDSSSDNSDDGHTAKPPPPNAKNKQTVSLLVSDLIGGGEYMGGEFERARSEARAGLMKKRVGQLAASLPTFELTAS